MGSGRLPRRVLQRPSSRRAQYHALLRGADPLGPAWSGVVLRLRTNAAPHLSRGGAGVGGLLGRLLAAESGRNRALAAARARSSRLVALRALHIVLRIRGGTQRGRDPGPVGSATPEDRRARARGCQPR